MSNPGEASILDSITDMAAKMEQETGSAPGEVRVGAEVGVRLANEVAALGLPGFDTVNVLRALKGRGLKFRGMVMKMGCGYGPNDRQ